MKNFITLAILLTFAFSSVSFAQTKIINIKLNKEFSLAARQKAYVKTDKLTVEFVSVLDDSRCPTDVDCVWAGSAKVQIKVSKGKMAAQIFELNTNLEPKTITYQGYEIEITHLMPAPKSDVDMKSVIYSASFIVKR